MTKLGHQAAGALMNFRQIKNAPRTWRIEGPAPHGNCDTWPGDKLLRLVRSKDWGHGPRRHRYVPAGRVKP